MDPSGSGGIRVEKLNDTDLHSWRQKMELVLGHREVDDMFDPTLCPRRPEDPEELQKWVRKDKNGSERTYFAKLNTLSNLRNEPRIKLQSM